jgi:hypothetical protein
LNNTAFHGKHDLSWVNPSGEQQYYADKATTIQEPESKYVTWLEAEVTCPSGKKEWAGIHTVREDFIKSMMDCDDRIGDESAECMKAATGTEIRKKPYIWFINGSITSNAEQAFPLTAQAAAEGTDGWKVDAATGKVINIATEFITNLQFCKEWFNETEEKDY